MPECRKCGAEVTKTTPKCRSCGTHYPTYRWHLVPNLVVLGIGALIFGWFFLTFGPVPIPSR